MEKSNSHLPVTDEEIVETLHRMLTAGEQYEAASLLRKSRTRFKETGYDNWNGGTYSITLYVQVAPETFTLLGERRQEVEQQLSETLRSAVSHLSTDSFDAKIAPLIVGSPGVAKVEESGIPRQMHR